MLKIKTNQTRISDFQMETRIQNVCQYDYKGYCKYGNGCLNTHFIEICNDKECRDSFCAKRHPRKCYYYLTQGNCKFNENCKYLHEIVTINKNENLEIENNSLKEEIKGLKEKLVNSENKLNMEVEHNKSEIKNMKKRKFY